MAALKESIINVGEKLTGKKPEGKYVYEIIKSIGKDLTGQDIEGRSYTQILNDIASKLELPIVPAGKVEITDTTEVDVTEYAAAQVVDENLIAENIKKDVTILGVTGTYEAEETPAE